MSTPATSAIATAVRSALRQSVCHSAAKPVIAVAHCSAFSPMVTSTATISAAAMIAGSMPKSMSPGRRRHVAKPRSTSVAPAKNSRAMSFAREARPSVRILFAMRPA